MTTEQQFFVRALIRFYDERGWDWGLAVEFLCHKYNSESASTTKAEGIERNNA